MNTILLDGKKGEIYINHPLDLAKEYHGWGTALKPSHEPIVLARKPLSEKSVVDNVIKWGTGGINIDKSRVGTEKVHNDRVKQMKNRSLADNVSNHQDQYTADDYERTYVEGRFPANFIHDGSDEVTELFPQTKSGGGSKVSIKIKQYIVLCLRVELK